VFLLLTFSIAMMHEKNMVHHKIDLLNEETIYAI